ncbi:MAG TPA: hypothetical protein VF221_21565, partial [Chloroflexota bacterium]
MGFGCTDSKTCPRVFETQRGTVVVQGYQLAKAGPTLAAPPDGELQVEMPRETFLALARTVERQEPSDDLFEGWHHSIFRLETLPVYLDEFESESCRAWLAGRPQPPRKPETEEWYGYIRNGVAAGRQWQRVHVVDLPLTDYLRYELNAYEESAALGYETMIARREERPELAELTSDFYLFDADHPGAFAILMNYDPDGRFIDMWRTSDPPVLD